MDNVSLLIDCRDDDVRLLLKDDGSIVNDILGNPPAHIKAKYSPDGRTLMFKSGHRAHQTEICRVEGLNNLPPRCEFVWAQGDRKQLNDLLRLCRPSRYDRTFFHPEFPHLISGR